MNHDYFPVYTKFSHQGKIMSILIRITHRAFIKTNKMDQETGGNYFLFLWTYINTLVRTKYSGSAVEKDTVVQKIQTRLREGKEGKAVRNVEGARPNQPISLHFRFLFILPCWSLPLFGFRGYPQVNDVRIPDRLSPLHPKLDVDPPVQAASKQLYEFARTKNPDWRLCTLRRVQIESVAETC